MRGFNPNAHLGSRPYRRKADADRFLAQRQENKRLLVLKGVVAKMRAAALKYNVSYVAVTWVVYGITWKWIK
jgi:hypothetical protein